MSKSCKCTGNTGEMNCPTGYTAICKRVGTECKGTCVPPLPEGLDALQTANWFLNFVKESDVPISSTSFDSSDFEILRKGNYQYRINDGTQVKVKFKTPSKILKDLRNLGFNG